MALYDIRDGELNKIASQLQKMAVDESAAEITEAQRLESIPEIKAIANNFIEKMNSYTEEIEIFRTKLKKQRDYHRQIKDKKVLGKKQLAEYEDLKKYIGDFLKSTTVKEMLETAEQFQIDINGVLGQVVKTVYVYQNEEGYPELYEITGTEILTPDIASRSNNIAARFRLDGAIKNLNLNTADEHMKKVIRSIGGSDYNFNKSNLDDAYVETMNRYRYSRTKNLRWVMWINQMRQWSIMKVSAAGDINEGYAAAVLLNKPIPSFAWHFIDWNIGDFMECYVAKVDNMSGLLAGDVTVGNIEYAIKSSDASMLSIRQMVLLAELIQKDIIKDLVDLNKYKKLLSSKAKTRNREIEWTAKQLNSLMDEDLLEYFDKQVEMML